METFEEHLATLKTPGHTWLWLKDFAVYDLKYNWNWGIWVRLGFPDQAYALAHSMWKEYHEGKSRGVCGQYTAMYVVAAREQGYKAGGICTWAYQGPGHARGWIVEKDGSVSIADNTDYLRNVYSSYEEFEKWFKDVWINGDKNYGQMLNDKFEIVYDTNGSWPTSKKAEIKKLNALGVEVQ